MAHCLQGVPRKMKPPDKAQPPNEAVVNALGSLPLCHHGCCHRAHLAPSCTGAAVWCLCLMGSAAECRALCGAECRLAPKLPQALKYA